jgi:hypothetical protein
MRLVPLRGGDGGTAGAEMDLRPPLRPTPVVPQAGQQRGGLLDRPLPLAGQGQHVQQVLVHLERQWIAVGEVTDPQGVRPRGPKVPLHQIRRTGRPPVGNRGPLDLAPDHTADAQLAHQPPDAVPAEAVALPTQLLPALAHSVHPVVVLPELADLRLERRVSDCPGQRFAGSGGVIGAPGDLQFGADRLDPEPFPMRVDIDDYGFGRGSSSPAKKATPIAESHSTGAAGRSPGAVA